MKYRRFIFIIFIIRWTFPTTHLLKWCYFPNWFKCCFWSNLLKSLWNCAFIVTYWWFIVTSTLSCTWIKCRRFIIILVNLWWTFATTCLFELCYLSIWFECHFEAIRGRHFKVLNCSFILMNRWWFDYISPCNMYISWSILKQ